jgi:hypothetical protein
MLLGVSDKSNKVAKVNLETDQQKNKYSAL